jgi:hypothetical protein
MSGSISRFFDSFAQYTQETARTLVLRLHIVRSQNLHAKYLLNANLLLYADFMKLFTAHFTNKWLEICLVSR